jgi:hypothetical protein
VAAAPDVDALVLCAKRLAANISVPCPSDEELSAKLNYVLIEREYFACWRRNIITLAELRNVLLAHLQTFLCRAAGVEEPLSFREDHALYRDVEAALETSK